jgi:Fe2+ transport system protein FeoA
MRWPFSRRGLAPSAAGRPLGGLSIGESGTIARVDAADPGRLVKLSSLGLMAGVSVTLVQRRPAVVVRVAETDVALDPEVADDIWIEPAGPAGPARG